MAARLSRWPFSIRRHARRTGHQIIMLRECARVGPYLVVKQHPGYVVCVDIGADLDHLTVFPTRDPYVCELVF